MSMTVGELVKILQGKNQELEVVIGENWMEISTVKVDDNDGIQHQVVVID